MKVVRLSALHTGHLYQPGNIPGTHFRDRLSRPQGQSVAGRIMSIKNSNDTIGNRTQDDGRYNKLIFKSCWDEWLLVPRVRFVTVYLNHEVQFVQVAALRVSYFIGISVV
jgi:hypothetical protein